MPKEKLTVREDLMVWQSIRSSLASWNSLEGTLLANGTTLLFAAFGVIFANAEKLGNGLTFFISFGLFLGTVGINLGIHNLSASADIANTSALELEKEIFGEKDNPRKLTTRLNAHPIWGVKYSKHYLNWSRGLSVAAGLLTLWRLFLWLGF